MTQRTGQTAEQVGVNGKVVKPSVRIETITPAKAVEILDEQNSRNRQLRESRVIHLAGILQRGEWRLTGDAIVFDLDGVLLNGQHRLAAAGAADMPIQVLVLRNLPRENQDVMDDTLSRKLADALKLRGETDNNVLAAGINWSARLTYAEITGFAHYRSDAARPSIPQLLQFFSDHPGIQEAMVQMRPVIRQLKLRPGPAVAVRWRLNQVDEAESALFFDSLRSGADLSEGSPVLALRRYCENERDRYRRKSAQPDFKWVAVTIKAWNLWRDGDAREVLQFNYTPLNKETWPEPH
jgi:phosphoglycolate phosphatase-like HAD superfamily hydrolase